MATRFLIITVIVSLLFQPFAVFAQYTTGVPVTPSTPPLTGTTTPVSPTTPTLQPFTPGLTTTTNGGNSFNGLNFSGVGGAVLSCANIGQSIVSSVSELFKSSAQKAKDALVDSGSGGLGGNGTSGEQPVTDKKATEELQKQTKRDDCLNGIAYAVAKNTLQQISSNTLNWVNTGFNGNPFYVRDTASYLGSIQNEKIASFLSTVPNSDPIFGNALRSSITQLTTGYSDGRLNQPMNTPEGIAYQNFQNDFTQGGWSAFLNPANNPIGALFKATDNLSNSINSAQQDVKDQLQAGNGFLNMQKCVEYTPITSTDVINPLGAYSSLCATITPANQAYCQSNAGKVAVGTQQQRCTRYETVTPGSVIYAQTAAITTSPIRQAEQADKINEVLGSFFEGLVNRLFSQGLGSLASATLGSGTSSGSNVVIGSNGLPISNSPVSVEDAFGYQRVNGGFNGEFDISRPQQLRAVLQTQMNFLNQSKDTQVAMASIVPTLGKLDYCLPGPNPSWTVGTNYNFQLFDSALQGKQPSQTLGNTISQLSSVGAAFPGVGTVVAVVGNIVGGLVNLAGGSEPVNVTTPPNFELFDKVSNGARQVSNYYLSRLHYGDNIDLVAYLERSYQSTVDQYKSKFSPDAITNAFISTNPTNPATVTGTVADMIDETGNLVYYNQAINQYGAEQIQNITQTQDAVQQLNAINDEVEGIVATAKDRYIKQMKAAGTPVDMACLNQAYGVSTAPLEGKARVESDTPDPIIQESKNANSYFYNHL